MKPVLFLRVASILTLIHAVLHTIGGVFGHIDPGAASVAVEAMKVNTFPLMGHTRSFWDFYRGMGIGVSISLTVEGVAFWLLGEVRRQARGDDFQPGSDCSCPPPPLTVAEALPLARARLKDAGEQYGEQALADRFGVTRYKVRELLSPQSPVPSLNGSAP